MRWAGIAAVIAALVTAGLVVGVEPTATVRVFQDDLRDSVFSGFLTLAGFLVTAATFVVAQVKEKVYDSGEYIRNFRRRQALGHRASRYANLWNLVNANVLAIFGSIITATLAVTVGMSSSPYAVAAVAATGAASVVFFATSVVFLYLNLRRWLHQTEDDPSE